MKTLWKALNKLRVALLKALRLRKSRVVEVELQELCQPQDSQDREEVQIQLAGEDVNEPQEVCAICLEPIDHLSLVTVCVHGATSHAVHHACGQDWYTNDSNECASCGQVGEKRYTQLGYCLRLIASITVNNDTFKHVEAMDALKVIGRTLLGIYKSKGVDVSPTLELGYSKCTPPNTAKIEMKINHAMFGRIHIPAELEDDKWYLSQDQGELVLVIKDGISEYATCLDLLPRRPKKFISVTEMLEGVFFPSLINPNRVFVNNIRTQFKDDPFSAVELHGKFYDLKFSTFEMQRVSQTQHIYMNEGLEDLIRDADINLYLEGLSSGPFTLLFDDGKVRKISLE